MFNPIHVSQRLQNKISTVSSVFAFFFVVFPGEEPEKLEVVRFLLCDYLEGERKIPPAVHNLHTHSSVFTVRRP